MDWQSIAIIAAVVAAAAAIIQAATAVVIVRLTRRLADLAAGSLEESGRQVETALSANREARLQGQLRTVPMLRLDRPTPFLQLDGELFTTIDVVNASGEPALALEVRMYALTKEKKAEGGIRATSVQVPVLPPGARETLHILSRDLKNIPSAGFARQAPSGEVVQAPDEVAYASDWVLVVADWKTMVGSHVSMAYEWAANSPEYEHGWRLRSAEIRPSQDSDERIVVGPD
jgi:hypothetical protein